MPELKSKHAVWRNYARTHKDGKPVQCVPGKGEVIRRGWTVHTGSDGKVIYDDLEAAESAAKELARLGWRPMIAYPCDRSKHGHYHLSTDHAKRERRRKRHA
jgi:hypothetical protein